MKVQLRLRQVLNERRNRFLTHASISTQMKKARPREPFQFEI
jgi:hypothetical protein